MKFLRFSATVGFIFILSQSVFPQRPSQKAKAPVKNVSSKEKSDAVTACVQRDLEDIGVAHPFARWRGCVWLALGYEKEACGQDVRERV